MPLHLLHRAALLLVAVGGCNSTDHWSKKEPKESLVTGSWVAFAIPLRVYPPCLILPDIHALSAGVNCGIISPRFQNETDWDAQCKQAENVTERNVWNRKAIEIRDGWAACDAFSYLEVTVS